MQIVGTGHQSGYPAQPAPAAYHPSRRGAGRGTGFKTIEYPIFPRHVMFGTSLYDGFVKPYCG